MYSSGKDSKSFNNKSEGFTVIEVTIVLVIIAIILSSTFVLIDTMVKNARSNHVKENLELYRQNFLAYIKITQKLPDTIEEMYEVHGPTGLTFEKNPKLGNRMYLGMQELCYILSGGEVLTEASRTVNTPAGSVTVNNWLVILTYSYKGITQSTVIKAQEVRDLLPCDDSTYNKPGLKILNGSLADYVPGEYYYTEIHFQSNTPLDDASRSGDKLKNRPVYLCVEVPAALLPYFASDNVKSSCTNFMSNKNRVDLSPFILRTRYNTVWPVINQMEFTVYIVTPGIEGGGNVKKTFVVNRSQ